MKDGGQFAPAPGHPQSNQKNPICQCTAITAIGFSLSIWGCNPQPGDAWGKDDLLIVSSMQGVEAEFGDGCWNEKLSICTIDGKQWYSATYIVGLHCWFPHSEDFWADVDPKVRSLHVKGCTFALQVLETDVVQLAPLMRRKLVGGPSLASLISSDPCILRSGWDLEFSDALKIYKPTKIL